MTPESPSLLLQRAATRLEGVASDAYIAKAPWKADGSVVWAADDHLILGGAPWDNDKEPDADADWIAMVDPSIAQPLANILRDAAFTLDAHPEYRNHYLSYIALAEAVLGEVPGE